MSDPLTREEADYTIHEIKNQLALAGYEVDFIYINADTNEPTVVASDNGNNTGDPDAFIKVTYSADDFGLLVSYGVGDHTVKDSYIKENIYVQDYQQLHNLACELQEAQHDI